MSVVFYTTYTVSFTGNPDPLLGVIHDINPPVVALNTYPVIDGYVDGNVYILDDDNVGAIIWTLKPEFKSDIALVKKLFKSLL